MSHKIIFVLVLVGLMLAFTACDASKEAGWTTSCIREYKAANDGADPDADTLKACVEAKRDAAESLNKTLNQGKQQAEALVATPVPDPNK
ncbi:MAG: hypothetical protein XU15_C0011G0112 [candidate division NC10 bacterium CSP1-5]|nr:MAG: hypothetical protein XU15_C0011G0112 [candidate division NC10 bacterium CSP1-5]